MLRIAVHAIDDTEQALSRALVVVVEEELGLKSTTRASSDLALQALGAHGAPSRQTAFAR